MKKLILALLLACLSLPALAAAQKESAFDRIVRTGVLRCGYYVFPPSTSRDPNTGKLSGMIVDYMESLGKRAGLKIEWTEEVTWANWVPELQAGRFDAACTPMWPDLNMMKVVTFTNPLFFAGIYPVVRADDARFKNAGFDRLNQPDVTFVTQDGNAMDPFTRASFPKAKFYTLPPSASGGEYYQTLSAKKADVILTDPSGLHSYEANNEKGKFRMIATDTPVKIQSNPLAVARGETDLRDFLDQSIRELEYSGDTDRILRKWEAEPGKTFLRVATPYKGQK